MRHKAMWRAMIGIVMILAMVACQQPADEQRIRHAIDIGAQAAEATDAGDFGDVISDDFDGNDGAFDRRKLLGLLRLLRLRGEHLSVLMGPVSLEPRGDRYVATFTVTLGSGGSRLLPSRLGIYHVTSAWRLEDGDWRCYQASWERALR